MGHRSNLRNVVNASYLLAACCALGLSACDKQPTQPQDPPPASKPTPVPEPKPLPESGHGSGGPEQPHSPPVDPTRQTDVSPKAMGPSDASVAASNSFGLSLYPHVAGTPGNVAYSSASMSVALSMTYAGAKGETADQMRKVLALPGDATVLHRGWASVVSAYNKPNEKLELALVNRLFGEKQYTFEQPFLDLVSSHYAAPLEPRDFRGAFEAQRVYINDWVAQKTRTRIKDLIPSGGLTADTRLVLVNALYFKAKWMNTFRPEATRPGAFFADGTREVSVPMMGQTEYHRFAAVDGVKLLEMRYEGGDFAMLVVLPDARDGLAAVEKNLSAKVVDTWVSRLQGQRVAVTLPKFKIDPPNSIELGDVLKKMGMPLAFERFKADFTAMANPPSPADRLHIDKVFHKAFVAVDEHGTEAAAATAVVMGRAGGMPAEPETFVADHPFLFFIRDTKTGLLLFTGRVSDPSPTS